jgi:ubiquinone/menaquinone biosynthesis C-methylase UbiE
LPPAISSEDQRALRTTFDESPELYERARAVARDELFDDLIALGRLAPGARLVEIGCGTGQATLPLAERVKIAVSSFENWDPGGQLFDAVLAFNSFHWVDPEVL